jgi:uncharacterized membrane protein YphA (DoxX/SURF4 family)
MYIYIICILISSLSFLAYGVSYFTSPHMKKEFKRFGLEKIGLLTIILELIGAIGLIIGFIFNPILIMSSLGLALLMLVGVIVRIRLKDSMLITLPALFYMVLNTYIFFASIN